MPRVAKGKNIDQFTCSLVCHLSQLRKSWTIAPKRVEKKKDVQSWSSEVGVSRYRDFFLIQILVEWFSDVF